MGIDTNETFAEYNESDYRQDAAESEREQALEEMNTRDNAAQEEFEAELRAEHGPSAYDEYLQYLYENRPELDHMGDQKF